MVAEILNAEVKGNLRGGAYLHQHIDPSDELCVITQNLLAKETWDYVVLQDQSQGPITNGEDFRRAVDALCPMIRAAGATPVLYATWAYRDATQRLSDTGLSYADMLAKLTEGYTAAAEANDALLAPVGKAFSDTRKLLDLYVEDDYHPSQTGSLLAAMTIAKTIREHFK